MAILVSELLVGGPKLISGTASAGNTDTSVDIDLSGGNIQEILNLVSVSAFKAASGHAIATVDFTTDADVLTVTFADPTEAITIYYSVLAR